MHWTLHPHTASVDSVVCRLPLFYGINYLVLQGRSAVEEVAQRIASEQEH